MIMFRLPNADKFGPNETNFAYRLLTKRGLIPLVSCTQAHVDFENLSVPYDEYICP